MYWYSSTAGMGHKVSWNVRTQQEASLSGSNAKKHDSSNEDVLICQFVHYFMETSQLTIDELKQIHPFKNVFAYLYIHECRKW